MVILFFSIFPETVKAKEKDQVGPQAQECFYDSSTDSCLTLPYSSDSPRPFPPSPVHSVSDPPKRVSHPPITTSNSFSDNSAVHNPIVHNLPTPVLSTLPISIPSQTFTPVLFTRTTNSYNTPSYFPFSSSSFPQPGPIVFPDSPPDYPHFRTTPSGSNSTLSNIAPPPSYPSGFQSTSGPSPFRGRGRNSRGTHSGRGRAPRGRRYRITSSTSCQTSPVPSYFWPDYQPSLISTGDASTNNALNLALMPRVFNHHPPSLPLNPLQYDFFTVLRAASPVVIFHCPSPLTQRSFSFVYSLSFTRGLDSKPLLVAGINQ